MARPDLSLPELAGQHGDIIGPASVTPAGGDAIAHAADAFGARLQTLAEAATGQRAGDEAAGDAAAGKAQRQSAATAYGRVYNQVAQQTLSLQREASFTADIAQATEDNRGNPAGYETAIAALKAGYKPTGFAELDATLAPRFDLHAQSGRAQVHAEFRAKTVDQAAANLQQDLDLGEQRLASVAATTPLDGAGPNRMAGEYTDFLKRIVKNGPAEAFDIGGRHFDADPARTGLLTAAQLETQASRARTVASTSWISAQADQVQGSTAKAAFVAKLRQRSADGDPIFAGLGGDDQGRLFNQLDADVTKAASTEHAGRIAAAELFDSNLEKMKFGGDVDDATMRQLATASGMPGKLQEYEYRLQYGFELGGAGGKSFDGDASAAPGFAASADFVIDRQEGGDAYVPNDNGKGPTKFGINSAAHPGVDIHALTRDKAVHLYRSYWDAVNGDRLEPGLALVAFDAAVNQGKEHAQQMLRESGGDVGKLLGIREREYRKLAASDPDQAKNLPVWLDRLKAVSARAARVEAFAGNQDGFATDPISFAMGGQSRPAVADVPALPIEGAFGGDAAGGFIDGLRQRSALGQDLAGRYKVPPRMLTNGEKESLKATIATDPTKAIALAGTASAAIGSDGASRLLRELGEHGDDADQALHIAFLAANGSGAIAKKAAIGFALHQQGAKAQPLKAGDPDEKWGVVAQQFAPALETSPAILPAARQVAELARLADTQTGQVQPLSSYLNDALGHTRYQGRDFGGVAQVNGRATLLPGWLAQDAVPDALHVLGEAWSASHAGPRASNGRELTGREISSAQIVVQGDGRYALVSRDGRGQFADAQGHPFRFSFDRSKLYLTNRLQGAVVPAVTGIPAPSF